MPSGTILASSDEFYARALDRIPRIMFVLGLVPLLSGLLTGRHGLAFQAFGDVALLRRGLLRLLGRLAG